MQSTAALTRERRVVGCVGTDEIYDKYVKNYIRKTRKRS